MTAPTTGKYLLITVEQARWLAQAVDGCAVGQRHQPFMARLMEDTGGDFLEIALMMKHQDPCPACSIEGQLSSCANLETQQLGRRLQRLIDRADAAR
jgi:hypothetical protein